LKETAKVRFGIKTGANEFFFLTEGEIKEKKIEKEFWMHKDKKGKWEPNYVIKSPKESKTVIVKAEDLKYRVLMVHKDKEELKGTNLLKYIEEGERKQFDKRPTCASRNRWFDLGDWTFATFFWTEFFFERSVTFYSPAHVFESDKHYGITPKIMQKEHIIGAYLNSSLIPLFRLTSGFQALGEGVLKMPVYEVASLPVLNPRLISKSGKKLEKALMKLESRDIERLYNEIGAESPEEVSLDKVKPDRRELDKIIMADILGLTDGEQLEVYRAVVDLVKSRLEKAKSTGKNKKKVEGIDINALKNAVIDRIEKEN